MLELSKDGRRVVRALIGAPIAWQTPFELAAAMGLDLEATTDLLASLDVDGWLSPWERESDVVVTLSVAAAARLGVRLVESGQREAPRWSRIGEPEPPAPRASGVFRDERAATLERVVDPSARPDEEVDARPTDAAGSRERCVLDGLPRPTLLVGLGMTPWPGPGDGRKASCPGCGSKRLGPTMYCLYCDRWGLDHLVVGAQVARVRPLRPAIEDTRRADLDRLARKDKRKACRVAQSGAEAKTRRRRHRQAV
jgi:hypothetical protein